MDETSSLLLLSLYPGASEGIENLTEKIEVLGHGQAVDWKQAYREVKNYYEDLAMVKLEKEEEKGESQTRQ